MGTSMTRRQVIDKLKDFFVGALNTERRYLQAATDIRSAWNIDTEVWCSYADEISTESWMTDIGRTISQDDMRSASSIGQIATLILPESAPKRVRLVKFSIS